MGCSWQLELKVDGAMAVGRRQERPRRKGVCVLTGELQAREGRPLCMGDELVQGVVLLTLADLECRG